MYVLQAILILLKVLPASTNSGEPLYFYFRSPLSDYIDYFNHVSWWIILIPTFISVADGIWRYWVLKNIAEESDMY